jgi:hypothetical protein
VLGQTKHFEARMYAVRAEAGICNGQVAVAFETRAAEEHTPMRSLRSPSRGWGGGGGIARSPLLCHVPLAGASESSGLRSNL